ncbi:MAG TPA: hypothetical protein PK762_07425, partial [Candidatus Kapabacteria bacterium]|nr:hypothetical protein [Candidatus Kapabacteria bacterium]
SFLISFTNDIVVYHSDGCQNPSWLNSFPSCTWEGEIIITISRLFLFTITRIPILPTFTLSIINH